MRNTTRFRIRLFRSAILHQGERKSRMACTVGLSSLYMLAGLGLGLSRQVPSEIVGFWVLAWSNLPTMEVI